MRRGVISTAAEEARRRLRSAARGLAERAAMVDCRGHELTATVCLANDNTTLRYGQRWPYLQHGDLAPRLASHAVGCFTARRPPKPPCWWISGRVDLRGVSLHTQPSSFIYFPGSQSLPLRQSTVAPILDHGDPAFFLLLLSARGRAARCLESSVDMVGLVLATTQTLNMRTTVWSSIPAACGESSAP